MIDFPSNPTDGQVVTINSTTYTWNNAKGVWVTGSSFQFSNQTPFYYNSRYVTSNKTILGSENVLSVGPISINDGVTVTIEDGGEWTIV